MSTGSTSNKSAPMAVAIGGPVAAFIVTMVILSPLPNSLLLMLIGTPVAFLLGNLAADKLLPSYHNREKVQGRIAVGAALGAFVALLPLWLMVIGIIALVVIFVIMFAAGDDLDFDFDFD